LTKFVEVPVSADGSVTIEVDEVDGGRAMRGGGSRSALMEQSTQTLQEGLHGLSDALQDIVAELRHASEVTRIEVELGLKLTGEAGFVVTKFGGEANFRVMVRWEPPDKIGYVDPDER
jgi:hypothetical protein